MNDIVLRALIAASVVLAFLGIACLTRPHREKSRNVRRECGNTIERRPNVRRVPTVVREGDRVRFDDRGLVVPDSRGPHVALPLREPCWADDEVTKVGGAT